MRTFVTKSGFLGVVLSFFMLLMSTAGPASANGPTVGRDAGMIFPLNNEDIQLTSENVTIELPGSTSLYGRVDCDYSLKNLTDKFQSFEVAFVAPSPFFGPQRLDRSADFSVYVIRQGIRPHPAKVNYERIERSRWDGMVPAEVDSLPVWEVHIPPQQTVRLRIGYNVSWSAAGPECFFTYHTKTAALWAGVVKRATITITFGGLMNALLKCQNEQQECLRWNFKPSNCNWTKRGFEWKFEDWEPSENIVITVENLAEEINTD